MEAKRFFLDKFMPDFGFENPQIENDFSNWIQINLSSYPHIEFRKNSYKNVPNESLITRKKKKKIRSRRISFYQRRTTQTRNESHLINFLS